MSAEVPHSWEIHDVTERKRAEESLAEAERLAAIARMAACIAHEINNPLAGITSAFRLVRRAVPEDHPDRGMVERIEREIARIANIVRQMYTLYPSQPEHRRAIVEAIEVLKKTKETFKSKALAELRTKLEDLFGPSDGLDSQR